jgi:hypothetical protein
MGRSRYRLRFLPVRFPRCPIAILTAYHPDITISLMPPPSLPEAPLQIATFQDFLGE